MLTLRAGHAHLVSHIAPCLGRKLPGSIGTQVAIGLQLDYMYPSYPIPTDLVQSVISGSGHKVKCPTNTGCLRTDRQMIL